MPEGKLQRLAGVYSKAESTNRKTDWRTTALATVCFFGCRRLSDVGRVRVYDVTWDEDRITVLVRKQKTDMLNEGDTFSMVARGKRFAGHQEVLGEVH
jgi:integrase